MQQEFKILEGCGMKDPALNSKQLLEACTNDVTPKLK